MHHLFSVVFDIRNTEIAHNKVEIAQAFWVSYQPWLTLMWKAGQTSGCCVYYWIWLAMLLLLYQDIYSYDMFVSLATLTNQVSLSVFMF